MAPIQVLQDLLFQIVISAACQPRKVIAEDKLSRVGRIRRFIDGLELTVFRKLFAFIVTDIVDERVQYLILIIEEGQAKQRRRLEKSNAQLTQQCSGLLNDIVRHSLTKELTRLEGVIIPNRFPSHSMTAIELDGGWGFTQGVYQVLVRVSAGAKASHIRSQAPPG